MATFYGNLATYTATNAVAGSVPGPSVWQTAGYINGREKVNIDFYVALGTEAAASVIVMGSPLPVGAKVLEVVLTSSANTVSLTVSVGDLNSATRYASANTDMQTLRRSVFNGITSSANGPYVIGTNPATPTVTNNDQQIILTTAGATLGVGLILGTIVRFTTD